MAIYQNTPSACAVSQPDDLRTLVEVDRRRGSIGLHIASDITRAARTTASLWLPPAAAEKMAQDILAAVRAWRADQAAVAWTEQQGGAA